MSKISTQKHIKDYYTKKIIHAKRAKDITMSKVKKRTQFRVFPYKRMSYKEKTHNVGVNVSPERRGS